MIVGEVETPQVPQSDEAAVVQMIDGIAVQREETQLAERCERSVFDCCQLVVGEVQKLQ